MQYSEDISGAENPCSGVAVLHLWDQITSWYKFPLQNLQVPLRLKAHTGVCPLKCAVSHLWNIIRQLFHGTWWIVVLIYAWSI